MTRALRDPALRQRRARGSGAPRARVADGDRFADAHARRHGRRGGTPQGLGHTVTAHLAARMVRSREHLDGDAGGALGSGRRRRVRDRWRPDASGRPIRLGDRAAAPARRASAAAADDRDRRLPGRASADRRRNAHARRFAEKSRVADYIGTQLCYDPNVLLNWVRSIREQGIDLPVHVSVPGMVDRRRLLEISARVGVGPSLRYLRKQGGIRNLFRLSKSSADRLVDALTPHRGWRRAEHRRFPLCDVQPPPGDVALGAREAPATNSIGSLVQTEVTPR